RRELRRRACDEHRRGQRLGRLLSNTSRELASRRGRGNPPPSTAVRAVRSPASMTERWSRGRLREGASAPASGEAVERLLPLPGVTIEQILSGPLDAPLGFRQDHDEWVVLLSGRASLVVAGADVALEAGDWLFLPAGIQHIVVSTAPGSSWLAVHVGAR